MTSPLPLTGRDRLSSLSAAIEALSRRPPELLALGGLLVVTAAFGRTFSKIELGFSWLHPTELLLVAIAALVLARTSPKEAWRRVQATGAAVPLLVLWLFGAIAAARGLTDWGFSLVLYDIGLVEYSVLVPLVALVVRSRSDLLWLVQAVAIGGLLAVLAYAITLWTPLEWDLGRKLNLIAVATGMYASLYAAWVLARTVTGVAIARWHYLFLVITVALVTIGAARAAWVALLLASVLIVTAAAASRQWIVAAGIVAALTLGVVASTFVEDIQIGDAPSPRSGKIESLVNGSQTSGSPQDSSGGRTGTDQDGSGALTKLRGSFEESTSASANARWRLAFWRYVIDDSVASPIFGIGFGQPANFVWSGQPYDTRDGDFAYGPDPFDVTAPHNSFLNVLYRVGLPAFVAVLFLLLLALFRLTAFTRSAVGENRAVSLWLTAGILITSAVAFFSVALEGPFMGIFFWSLLALGLLAPRLLRAGEPSRT